MIFRLYNVYNKHEMMKMAIKPEKNYKCSDNFAIDCTSQMLFNVLQPREGGRAKFGKFF